MATAATVNSWLDLLSASVLEKRLNNKSTTSVKRLQDTFRRRVRKHNFGRTNQFEVENRLDGLEEKFQILSLDNLSDALRQRRIELKPFENHWLPDILDLFLHLSGNPAANQTLLELYRIPPRIGTPPPLKWNDLLADSPIIRNDDVWKIPDFRNAHDSGYDDDFASSIGSAAASPQQNRHRSREDIEFQTPKFLYDLASINESTSEVSVGFQHSDTRDLSELQFIRQALFLLRGYSTDCFTRSKNQLVLEIDVKVRDISQMALSHIAKEIVCTREYLDRVVSWLSAPAADSYIAAMQCTVEDVLQAYYKSIDYLQQEMIEPDADNVVSLSSVMSKVGLITTDLYTVAGLLSDMGKGDATTQLETLYEAVEDSQLCADVSRSACLILLLKSTLNAYLEPIIKWMVNGSLENDSLAPFIEIGATSVDLRKIWNEQFRLTGSVEKRAPNFLADTVVQVLACGRTSAFLHQLRIGAMRSYPDMLLADQFELPSTEYTFLPFTQAFEQKWQQFLEGCLHHQTLALKSMLSTYCNLGRTLDSIQQLYFPRSGLLMHDVEARIFDRIDRCIDSWNDRFQLKDMLEDAFSKSENHSTIDSVNIHAAYTSSRTMLSQRTSVKILSSVSFEYILSWPLANIISDASMMSYRRIALVLMQIKRAKYALERTGYVSAVSIPLGPDTSSVDQTFAQVLAFSLLTFVNTLFDSLMLSSIWPATDAMQAHMQAAPTVDEMIRVHHSYITRLECSCLAAPRLKILRQSLISILDLCLRFSDLASNPTKVDNDASDHEASSFMSAKSRNKSLRMEQYGSDEEDDDYSRRLGDGYSSFIVLDDDTSIVKELKKVKAQYEKQVKFLISGLRGVSKGSHETAHLDVLADRLSWLTTR